MGASHDATSRQYLLLSLGGMRSTSNVVVVGHGRPVYTGWRELFYNGFLLAAYAGSYLPLARPRMPIQPLWRLGARP